MVRSMQVKVRSEKQEFEIEMYYFKRDGKFDGFARFKREFRVAGHFKPNCFMPDVVAHVRGLRDSGGQGALYGRSIYDEGWDGYILVNCKEGYPVLILPNEV
jgi:hypothetical protein